MAPQQNSEAEVVKEQGNACMKDQKYTEAILHYSQAIQLDPSNAVLYSNRSLAFLKIQQLYHALQDANETIRLRPDWAKGYFRRGEVEFAASHYIEALSSYTKAFCIQKDDMQIFENMKKVAAAIKKEERQEKQVPWVGAGIGIIVGVMIVLGDYFAAEKPVLVHPLLKMLIVVVISSIGYAIGKGYRSMIKSQRRSLLDPPIDLFKDSGNNIDLEEPGKKSDVKEPSRKYTKAQARQRYRKQKQN